MKALLQISVTSQRQHGISSKMTNWPKADQYVAVSCIMSPVTQTAEVEVNNASEKGVVSPLRLENGNIKRKVPKRLTPEKPRMII